MSFWSRQIQTLGVSVLNLLSAELGEVTRELGSTRKAATRVAVHYAVVFALAFWCVGALTFSAIAALALRFDPWLASLIVAVIYLVLAVIAYFVARGATAAIELPTQTVRRRLDSHVSFWKDEMGMGSALAGRGKKSGKRRSSRDRKAGGSDVGSTEEPGDFDEIEEDRRRRTAWGEGRRAEAMDDLPPGQQW